MEAAGGGGGGSTSTAYIILGHGSEQMTAAPITVPANCTLVVKALCAETTRFENVHNVLGRNINYAKYLSPFEPNSLKKLRQKYGSLAFYREGEMCPDFEHDLMPYFWNYEKTLINFFYGGIVPISRTYPLSGIGTLTKDFNSSTPISEINLPERFKFSIYPTRDEVAAIVSEYISRNGDKSVADFMNYIESDAIPAKDKKLFYISQSEIFEKVLSGYLRPGVFYHFNCRFTSEDYSIFKTNKGKINNNWRESHFIPSTYWNTIYRLRNLNTAVSRKLLYGEAQEPLPRLKMRNTPTRKVLKSHIAETLLHRRPYLPPNIGKVRPTPALVSPNCTGGLCLPWFKKGGTRKRHKNM